MQETNESAERSESSAEMEVASPPKRYSFVGAVVAAAVLVIVMILMLLAVWQSRPATVGKSNALSYNRSERGSSQHYQSHIVIERFESDLRTNVAGTRGLQIKGYVKNTGELAVHSADLKCYFRTKAGAETSIELPLVIDSALDEVSDGPLMPSSGREFGLRIGEFPYDLEPEILQMEPVNIHVLTGL